MSVDLDNKVVHLDRMEPIPYDYLVVSMGAVVNFWYQRSARIRIPVVHHARCPLLKTHINRLLEAVDKNPALIDEGALNFCIVGGGPTGVETAGALSELCMPWRSKTIPICQSMRKHKLFSLRRDQSC